MQSVKKIRQFLLTAIIGAVILLPSAGQIIPERQWPGYRGYLASGVLDNANLPSTFDLKEMVNIRWKAEIPGMGISSPAIWGDKLFITSAISEADKAGFKPGLYGDVTSVNDTSVHTWKVYCINKNTGKVIWERTSFTGIPKMKRHPKSTHANTTVAVDGKYAVAFFGSEGLYCYDFNGKLQWEKNFGELKSVFFTMKNAEWEFASSPVIYDGKVIIQCDVLDNSFLAAYDVRNGKELWKALRDEYPGWCTPNIYKNAGRTCIAVNGYKHRGGYDFETGKEVWRMSGGGDIQIPTPVIGKDLIYFNSAHGKVSPVIAVKTNASGDITLAEGETSNEYIQWYIPRGGSYIHTMLLYRDRLYNMNWNGTISCLNPFTGKEIYNAKLGKAKSFIASPVASDGRIYIVDEEGTVYIIQDGDTFNQLEEIPLGEICMTAPAITDGMIIFRTQHQLVAVGKK
ncbi:MAG: PQQ-binding-like beta-propeller repeat protein [Bacteroidales bacterium]|nr:PQQ-binding-like beta-propeller repeat protein [Bacteroidales bacterium]